MSFFNPAAEPTCLGRTCLHWSPDGELDREDLQRVLARLAASDAGALPLQPGDPLKVRPAGGTRSG